MRREGWEERLVAVIAAARGRPFAWGAHDCMLFAADAVAALTGADPAAGLRGAYDSEIGAARIVARAGGLAALADDRLAGLAARLSNPKLAQRGDLCLFAGPRGETLGVVYGAHILAVAPGGLTRVPLATANVIATWAAR